MSEIETLRAELLAHRAAMAPYQMLCQALIATHPDRRELLSLFVLGAQGGDAAMNSSADSFERKEVFRMNFDRSYNQIVAMLR